MIVFLGKARWRWGDDKNTLATANHQQIIIVGEHDTIFRKSVSGIHLEEIMCLNLGVHHANLINLDLIWQPKQWLICVHTLPSCLLLGQGCVNTHRLLKNLRPSYGKLIAKLIHCFRIQHEAKVLVKSLSYGYFFPLASLTLSQKKGTLSPDPISFSLQSILKLQLRLGNPSTHCVLGKTRLVLGVVVTEKGGKRAWSGGKKNWLGKSKNCLGKQMHLQISPISCRWQEQLKRRVRPVKTTPTHSLAQAQSWHIHFLKRNITLRSYCDWELMVFCRLLLQLLLAAVPRGHTISKMLLIFHNS